MTHKSNPSEIKTYLKTISIFKDCSDSFLAKISANAQCQIHKKGKILFVHDDTIERFYIIKSGWVKLFRETLDGAQAVVDILDNHHVLGEIAIFENNIVPYSAEVVSNAEIISLPLADLKKEIKNDNQLALNMLKSMAYDRRRKDKEIEHRTIQNAPQRIGCFLLRLIDQNQKGPVTIHLPYDKTLVAARLGMQPETFSRALSKLRDETGIRINGATIEMESLDQIVRYSCAACSSSFPCQDLKTAS